MKIFDLEAVVKIVTGGADKQLAALEKQGMSLDKSMSANFKNIGMAAARLAGPAVLGALGAALATIGATALKTGQQMADAMARFQVETGATTKEVQAFSDTLRSLYTKNTDGIEDLADVLGAVRQQFGDLGDNTQEVTQSILDFSKVTGIRGTDAVDNIANAMRAWDVEMSKLPKTLDTLAAVQQETGARSDKLLAGLAATAPVVKSLGLSFEETAAFMGLLERSGAGVEAANESLVMLLRASTETTTAQAEAFKALGIEMDAAGRPLGGASQVFRTLVTEMEKGSLEGDRLTAALAIVGTEAGKKLIGALKGAEGGFDALSESVRDAEGTVAEASSVFDTQIGEKLTLLFRATFGEIGSQVGDLLNEHLGPILDWATEFAAELKNFDDGQFLAYLAEQFPAVAAALEPLKGSLGDLYDTLAGAFGDLFEEITRFLSENSDTIAKWAKGGIKSLDEMLAFWTNLYTAVADTVNFVVKRLQDVATIAGAASAAMGTTWQETVAGMQAAFEVFADNAAGLWQDILQGVLTGIQALPDQAKGPLAEVEKQLAQTVDKLNNRKKPTATLQEAGAQILSAPSAGMEVFRDAVANAEAARAQDVLVTPKTTTTEKAETTKPGRPAPGGTGGESTGQEVVKVEAKVEEDITKKVADETAKRQAIRDRAQAERLRNAQAEAEERARRAQEAADREFEIDQQLLQAKGQTLEAAIRLLERERDEAIAAGVEKMKAEELFQRKKAKLQEEYAEKRRDIEFDLNQKILEAQGKGTEAAANAKIEAIKDTVEAAREAGVEEAKISEYIAAERKKLQEGDSKTSVEEASSRAPRPASADPRMSAEDAFSGVMQGLSFSLDPSAKPRTGQKADPASQKVSTQVLDGLAASLKRSDPASAMAASKLTQGISGTAGTDTKGPEAASPGKQAINDTITVQVLDQTGTIIGSNVFRRGQDNEDLSVDYQLGQF